MLRKNPIHTFACKRWQKGQHIHSTCDFNCLWELCINPFDPFVTPRHFHLDISLSCPVPGWHSHRGSLRPMEPVKPATMPTKLGLARQWPSVEFALHCEHLWTTLSENSETTWDNKKRKNINENREEWHSQDCEAAVSGSRVAAMSLQTGGLTSRRLFQFGCCLSAWVCSSSSRIWDMKIAIFSSLHGWRQGGGVGSCGWKGRVERVSTQITFAGRMWFPNTLKDHLRHAYMQYIPVVPHKAVAEVSKIGNL